MSETTADSQDVSHQDEPHSDGLNARLNWLRAGVLGANDGIVSVAGIVVGVAGASVSRGTIGLAGLAGLVAGALSMAAGEYVSVSSQRDSERALIEKERHELATMPDEELAELTEIYRGRGLSPELAHQVAVQLTEHDALGAHLEAELNLDADDLSSPWAAAFASALSFTLGALLPLAIVLLTPPAVRVVLTFGVVVAALALTGFVSARLGQAGTKRAVLRNVTGGAAAMIITYGVGRLVGQLGLNDRLARALGLGSSVTQTTSPITTRRTAPILAAPESVFEAALSLPLPQLYCRRYGPLPPIVEVRDQQGPWESPGQTRIFRTSDGGEMREEMLSIDAPLRFANRLTVLSGPFRPLVATIEESWSFAAVGTGTEASWEWNLFPRSAPAALPVRIVARLWLGYARAVQEQLSQEVLGSTSR